MTSPQHNLWEGSPAWKQQLPHRYLPDESVLWGRHHEGPSGVQGCRLRCRHRLLGMQKSHLTSHQITSDGHA